MLKSTLLLLGFGTCPCDCVVASEVEFEIDAPQLIQNFALLSISVPQFLQNIVSSYWATKPLVIPSETATINGANSSHTACNDFFSFINFSPRGVNT